MLLCGLPSRHMAFIVFDSSRLRPDSAMMGHAEHEGALYLGLRHRDAPFFRLVGRDRAQDTALVILRHDATYVIINGELRETL